MCGRLGLYKAGLCGWVISVCLVSDWVTSLRISPQTCTGHTATAFAFAFSGSNVDCAGWVLALLSLGVVVYHVVRKKAASGGPGGAASTSSTPLPGTFLGLALDLASDRLYDLVDDIPDVMGLRATRPSAAIVKVMSVPDSRCVRVVSPDDHVTLDSTRYSFMILRRRSCHLWRWAKLDAFA